jgi:PAS domain S-box-containing protein
LAPAATTGDGSVIAAVRDVTGLRAFEEALRESELRLRQITEASDVSFLLYQIDPPRFLYLSPGVARLLGRDDAALSGDTASLMDMVHQDDRERVRAEYILPSRAGRPARSNHRVLLPDGSVRWIRAIASPVLRPDGPPERIVMTMEDISADAAASTRLREAETAARGATEAKNNFLSRMSHELRTPLNAVLGFGQLLERPLAGTEHAAAVGHILKGGWHLLDLINDVLDITRIESGEIAVSVEPIPVATLIVEAVELMQPIADEARVALSAQGDVPDAYVLADRQRMRQVLLNLISNAIKYNGREGCVEVSWASVGDQLRLCVRDDGPGIPEHLLGRVFTPFDRLGAEATGVEGAGIGLALTRSLVELMHGSIEVESSVPGGTCFTVTLPAAPPNALVQNGIRDELNLLRTTTPEGGSPPSLRVLYIEDNEPNVLVFEEVLRLRPGWQLIHAGLGALGVELAKAHRPDLILLDLHLPDLPGAEALAALLRVPSTAGTPVVILSADATPAHSKGLLEAGASRYLTKPMRIHEILELLDETAANRGRSSVR